MRTPRTPPPSRSARAAIAALVGVAAAGGAGCERPAPPTNRAAEAPAEPTAPAVARPAPPVDPTRAEFLGLAAPKPATWLWQPPRNPMRVANYVVPGVEGHDAASLVITHFGAGRGGTVEANTQRWVSQFRDPDLQALVERLEVGGMPVTVVELAGAWRRPGTTWYTPDQRLLGAVIEAPVGAVFVRLAGDSVTVERSRDAFMTMIRGIAAAEDG